MLVDLDVNSLKELDIVAFGPRARIAKAIRELRATYEPQSANRSDIDTASMVDSTRGGSFRDDRFSPQVMPTSPEFAKPGFSPVAEDVPGNDATVQPRGLGLREDAAPSSGAASPSAPATVSDADARPAKVRQELP